MQNKYRAGSYFIEPESPVERAGTITSSARKASSTARNTVLALITETTSSLPICAATSKASATGGVTCPIATDAPKAPQHYRDALVHIPRISHLTVEATSRAA